jgi:hypothetical protein
MTHFESTIAKSFEEIKAKAANETLEKADSNCEPFLDNLPLVCIVLHGRN